MWRSLSVLGIGIGLACSGGPVHPGDPGFDVDAPAGVVERPPEVLVPSPSPSPSMDSERATEVQSPVGPVLSAAPVVVSRERLERELAEVEGVDDVIRFRPHVTVSGIDGFKVTAIPLDSPITGIGLLAGDVVHSVNGHRLGSLGDVLAAAAELQTADRFEGEITRGGQRRTLTVQLK